jgi:modulator of FtsH protease
MGTWQTFFATQAGVSAALTGLVFVALSINLKQILGLPGLAGRAGEALLLLLFPVVTGLTAVTPQTSVRGLGWQLLAAAAVLAFAVGRILRSGRRAAEGRPAREFRSRAAAALAPVGAALVAGLLMAGGSSQGLWWEAAVTLLCVTAGVADAWILLVEILR